MTKDEVEKKLIELAGEQAGVSPDEITRATHFHNDLQFDSLDDVEYAMEVEDAFGVKVDDDKVERLQTIEAVMEEVMQQLDAQAV